MSLIPSLFGYNKPVTNLRNRLDDVFDDFLRDWPDTETPKWLRPAVDIAETKDALEVKMDLPDMNRDDIHLELRGDQLLVKGEKKVEKEDKDDKGYHIRERTFGSFHRVIPLPYKLDDTTDVKASYDNGVLTVMLPKPPEGKDTNKRIKIS